MLCTCVDFPEPAEMLTSCFAVATWHFRGELEVEVNILICTRNDRGTEPALSVFSHGLLAVLPQKGIYTSLENMLSAPLSLTLCSTYLNKQLEGLE